MVVVTGTVYTGTVRTKLETALVDLEQKITSVNIEVGSVIVADVARIGKGKYWQGFLIYDI